MNATPGSSHPPQTRLLTFRSGGWVLLLAGVFVLITIIWQLVLILGPKGPVGLGDGEHVESYGFDLSTTLIQREQIIAAGLRKDGLPALVSPVTEPISKNPLGKELGGVRKIAGRDGVIGVVIKGEARAYPLWVLEWHEVANDVLGGEPIVVTYSPLSGGAAVFSRRVGEETLAFGVSGLLTDSNLLMYDRRAKPADESLWNQLQARAIAGPGAVDKRELTLLPMALTTYRQWRERYPESTVILPDLERKKFYRRETYSKYLSDDELRFPSSKLPPPGRLRKLPLAASLAGGEWKLRFGEPGEAGLFEPADVAERSEPRMYAYWFAWYALRQTN